MLAFLLGGYIDTEQWSFSGVSTFAHLKHVRCLTTPYEPFDIGIIGAPFDTAVSYRPGMVVCLSSKRGPPRCNPYVYIHVLLPLPPSIDFFIHPSFVPAWI